MGEQFKLHLMIHPRDNVGQADDGLEDVLQTKANQITSFKTSSYSRHGKVVVITPIESHWCLHISQGILWNWTLVVLEVLLVTAPVIAMEPSLWLLLSIV